jgi:lipopolysaccharide export system protein LptA
MKRLAVLIAVLCAPAAARAQATQCDLSTSGQSVEETINGVSVRYGSGGIRVVCKSRGLTLTADSGSMTGDQVVNLYGRVHYDEPTRIDLHSDFLTYYLSDERVNVRGHVQATLPSGSTLIAPEATLLRSAPRIRTIDEITAIGNPTLTIAARGDSAKPVAVNATTIYMRGDSLIYASRNVVINRADLITHSDSAFVDGRTGTETIRLMFKPSVEGLSGRKFRLEGDIIDAYSKNRKLDRVIARGKAKANSQDMDIVADTIDLRMSNDAMERAIAWSHGTQAVAKSPQETITADSIDVRMPNQKVRVVYAVRHARAEADADTVRFRTKERDWLRGETVVAWFDSTAKPGAKDTSSTPPLQRILASHSADSAQAYYHMAAADTSIREPAISYVRGREIRIDFANRQVAMVSVTDSVTGVYLEPKRDTTKTAPKGRAPARSTGAKAPVKPPATVAPKKPPAFKPEGKL